MKFTTLGRLAALVVIAFPLALHAAPPAPVWGRAADNKILAQAIANRIMAENPDLTVVGVHASHPGTDDHCMIACNFDRIGKPDSPDDTIVIKQQKTVIDPSHRESQVGILLPLHDADGNAIGLIVLGFKYRPEDIELDVEVRSLVRATALRDAAAKQIPSQAALFERAD